MGYRNRIRVNATKELTIVRTMKTFVALAAVLTFACVQTLQAAFIVEPVPGGKALANYSWIGGAGGAARVNTTLGGTAPGLSGTGSHAWGGTVAPHVYQFSYTPGPDVDNTVYTPGLLLGDNYTVPNYATGLTGGGSGIYNVYATWVVSANIGSPTTVANANFLVSSDGPLLTPPTVNQNTGMSGGPGGNAGWFYLGTVGLTAGNTYTVVLDPIVDNYVSVRMAGVMWEMVPEPSTLALAMVGGLLLFGGIARRRNR